MQDPRAEAGGLKGEGSKNPTTAVSGIMVSGALDRYSQD